MTRFILYFLLVICLPSYSFSQITLTNAHFPQAGDKLYLAVDTFPSLDLTPPSSTYQTWNFQFLEMEAFEIQEIKAASAGSVSDSFPNADIIIPAFGGDGYTKVHADSIELMGFLGAPIPNVANFDLLVKMDPFATTYNANMTYGSTAWDDGAFFVEVDVDSIPPEADLPLQDQLDSARINFTVVKEDTVDAYGSLTTPFGTYEVIRVKETQYRNVQVHVKHEFFGWVDIATFNVDGVGPDTLIYYNFLNDQSKEPICRVLTSMNQFGVTFSRAWWKVDAVTVSTDDFQSLGIEINTFPNPATTDINIEMNSFPNGNYNINIFNILGRRMNETRVAIFGDETVTIPIDKLNKGIYLYNIVDDRGKILTTQRFFVVRP